MDVELLRGYVLGLTGLFTVCLFLLVIALGFRDLIRRWSRTGTVGKRVENLNSKETYIVSGSMLPDNQGKAGFGFPSRDTGMSERDRAKIRRSDR